MAGKCLKQQQQRQQQRQQDFFQAFFKDSNKFNGGLHETVFAKRPKSCSPSCGNKRLNPG